MTKFFPRLFSLFAAASDKIAAYVRSTSSLNPPVDLNPSIISEVTGSNFEIFAISFRMYSVVL